MLNTISSKYFFLFTDPSQNLNQEAMMLPWVISLLTCLLLPSCLPNPHRGRHHPPEPHAEAYHISRDQFDPHRDSEEFRRDASDDKREFTRRDSTDDDPLVVQTKKGKVRGSTVTAVTGKKVSSLVLERNYFELSFDKHWGF